MKQLGLISLLGLALVALPGAARAANGVGWRGGGHVVAQVPRAVPAPVPRSYATPRYYAAPATPRYYAAPRYYPAPRYYATPAYRGGYHYPRYASAHTRAPVYVPGYWGLQGDTRVWVASDWSYPPFAGWAWVVPHWAWNGYQWVWQEGTWAPPY